MTDKILIQSLHDDQIVCITLNAPKANILDSEMMGGLREVLEEIRNKPQLKLIQFTGAGEHFCFGASVAEHTRDNVAQMLKQFHGLFYALAELAIPTAALVSGQCLGGGLELALMCNFMFLDKSAKLGQPEINLGVFAPPASLILPLKVGQARADELLLTGKIISAPDAVNMGLAAQLYDDRESMTINVDAWAVQSILTKSAASLRCAVRAARTQFNEAVKNQLAKMERFYIDELMATHDANEGIQSFLERRKPEWQNR
ncbi:MAG: enoyl-CoA hydratase/isomerase family protein [Candidatus Zixiibacteriota bacterium]|nr:MAG: enoyl-CoA hydratase/isomerase family protein [candidate division Zixibacteria bacterium]